MNNTTTHHLKCHFLAIFAPFTLLLSINGINTPLRHDLTNLTPFRANMGKIRRKEAETDSLLRMVLIKLLRFIRNKLLRLSLIIIIHIISYTSYYICHYVNVIMSEIIETHYHYELYCVIWLKIIL